jgi:hypothetical protein
MKITSELQPVSEGIRLQWNMKLDHKWPGWLRRPLTRILVAAMRLKHNFKRMDQLISKDALAR